jgi:outer membrane protein assembly factor BamE (lipoprotein component of BamABCDE complex)
MKIRIVLSALAATSGLLLAVLPGQASAAVANDHVTQAQIDAVQTGESSSDVISTLGTPQGSTNWMDGSHSLLYQTSDNLQGTKRVYVDMDSSGKVIAVEVLPLYD